MTGKGPQSSNVNVMNLLQNSQYSQNIFFFRKSIRPSFAGACLQKNTKLYHNLPGETENQTNLHLEHHDYRIYYVNIDLRRQYGISVAKSSETSLAARSKEKRLYSQATRLLILKGTCFVYILTKNQENNPLLKRMILVKKSSGRLNLIADIDFSLLQVWLGHAKTTHLEPQSFYHTYHCYEDMSC